MGNQKGDAFLRELQCKSDAFAAKATRLSKVIENIDDFLQQLPGKVEVSVPGEKHSILEFSKHSHGWVLWYGNERDGYNLTAAPVEIKAEAAKFLPKLIEVLVAKINDRLSTVDAGLKSLEGIPYLDIEGMESDA